jgi:hypothetical protein
VAISPVVGPGGGIVASPDGRVFLTVPPGAVSRAVTVTITPQASNGDTPTNLFYLFHIDAADDLGAPVSTLARPITVTVLFRAADLVGLPDGSPQMFWLDESKGAWVVLGGRVDWGQNVVSVALSHFSDFALGVTQIPTYGVQDLPTVHGFVSDDWSGNSSIHYPLVLPPGPGKLNLHLSLDYSSENVNAVRAGPEFISTTNMDEQRAKTFNRQAGVLGWGWDIGGLGAVVNTLDAGRTYLNAPGLSVEVISSTLNGWQTDPQSFAKISHNGNQFSGDPWVVQTTDGITYTFGSPGWGNGMAGNINSNGCYTVTREARLTKVSDAYGNSFVITYATEARGVPGCANKSYVRAIYPTRIEYFAGGQALGTARVNFTYEDRLDTNVQYHDDLYHEVYWSDQRLDYIAVKVRSDASAFIMARKYDLAYS